MKKKQKAPRATLTASEILTAARKVIEKPENWTRDVFARDKKGESTYPPYGPSAVCFCAHGAMVRVASTASGARRMAYCLLANEMPEVDGDDRADVVMKVFNDDRDTKHADVVAAFDRAIVVADTLEGLGTP